MIHGLFIHADQVCISTDNALFFHPWSGNAPSDSSENSQKGSWVAGLDGIHENVQDTHRNHLRPPSGAAFVQYAEQCHSSQHLVGNTK